MVSSIGASAMPWRAKSLTVALTLWPIFRIAGSSSTGAEQRQRRGERHLARRPARRRGRPTPATWRERQVGGLARADGRGAMPTSSARISSAAVGLDGERHRAALADARDPGGERRRRRAGSRSAAWSIGAHRRPARGRPAAPAPGAASADGRRSPAPRRRASPRPGRRGARNSISPRKASSVVGVGLAHLERRRAASSSGDVAPQRDEVARDADLVGVVEQHLAALRLLDLAGAGEQRVEVAVLAGSAAPRS